MTANAPSNDRPDFWEKRRLIRESDLTTQQKLLLYVLCDYAGNSEWAFPRQETISRDVSVGIRQVQRIISDLREAGLIEDRPRGRANSYSIQWARLATPTSPITPGKATPTSPIKAHTPKQQATPTSSVLATPTSPITPGKATPTSPLTYKEELPKEPPRRGGGIFQELDSEMLRIPGRVLEWFQRASSGDTPPVSQTDTSRLNVVALGMRVTTDHRINHPVAVFRRCIEAGDFKFSQEVEDRAREAIRDHDRRMRRESGNSAVSDLADSLNMDHGGSSGNGEQQRAG